MKYLHSDRDKFMTRVALIPFRECWEWIGMRTDNGRGAFYGTVLLSPGPTTTGAHRIAYKLFVGPIPPGLFVLHRCDNPGCVRPDHLFLGTHADNVLDWIRKGRTTKGKPRYATRRDLCSKGHPIEATLGTMKGRFCPTCAKARRRARTERETLARRLRRVHGSAAS